jgi:DNA-binding winged helix-turn-helix (wHTH) protein
MAQPKSAIVTQDELCRVWGGELRAGDRSVDVYVSKLRRKLEAALPDRRFIHTHPAFGYRFQPQPSPGAAQGQATAPAHARDGSGLSRDVHIRGLSA